MLRRRRRSWKGGVAGFKSAERRRRGTQDRARRDTWRPIRLGDKDLFLGLVLSIQSTGPGSSTCRASWAGDFLRLERLCPCLMLSVNHENQQIKQRTASLSMANPKLRSTSETKDNDQKTSTKSGMGSQLNQTEVRHKRGSTSSLIPFQRRKLHLLSISEVPFQQTSVLDAKEIDCGDLRHSSAAFRPPVSTLCPT
jgi:hypothetical protein